MKKKRAILQMLLNISVTMSLIQMPGFSFTGEYTSDCQLKSVQPSLMCLVSMLLNGPNIESQDFEESQACLTIAQLIIFNMKKIKKLATKSDLHNHDREPPLPLYLGT